MPRILSTAGGALGAIALASLAIAPAANAAPAFKGSAFAVKVDVKAVGASLISVPPLPEAKYTPGSDKSVLKLESSSEIADLSHGLISAKVLNARSNAMNGTGASRASAADLFVGLKTGSNSRQINGLLGLSAELISAKCSVGPDGIMATSKLVDVTLRTIAGQEKKLIDLAAGVDLEAPAPNTEINVPGVGKVVLNEQIKTDTGITVNAIHVHVSPLAKIAEGDIVVSQAACFETAGEPGPDPSNPGESPEPTATASEEPSTPPGDPTNPPGDGNGDDLPVTGFKLLTFIGIGAALVAAGGAVLWFFRRRGAAEAETA